MSRSMFIVLAVLALLSTVSAQMSSSSSYMAPASSTGAASSSSASASGASSATGVINPINPTGSMSSTGSMMSSSSAFPANTYSVFFTVDFAYPITTENINATAQSVQGDIIYNLATLSNEGNSSLIGNVFVTNINGTAVSGAPMARRLLQASTYSSGVTYIILGSVQGVSPATLVQQFSNAAANGNLVTVYTNATIPKQTVSVAAISAVSSSSTGLGSTGGASSAASASIALLFAAVASMALLL